MQRLVHLNFVHNQSPSTTPTKSHSRYIQFKFQFSLFFFILFLVKFEYDEHFTRASIAVYPRIFTSVLCVLSVVVSLNLYSFAQCSSFPLPAKQKKINKKSKWKIKRSKSDKKQIQFFGFAYKTRNLKKRFENCTKWVA